MITLGHFKYHIYEIKLEGNDEETEYTVICIQRTLRTMDVPVDKNTDMQVHPFDDLRKARSAFENAVHYCVGRTSFTDVSLFQQQTNGV